MKEVICPNCGVKQRHPDARFCQSCGHPLQLSSAVSSTGDTAHPVRQSFLWLWVILAAALGIALTAIIIVLDPGGKILHPHSPQPTITIVAIDTTAPIGSIHKGGRDAVRKICY
jgi:uncharacterized membrane protein YvbJ